MANYSLSLSRFGTQDAILLFEQGSNSERFDHHQSQEVGGCDIRHIQRCGFTTKICHSVLRELASMLSAHFTRAAVRTLDWLAEHTLSPDKRPSHLHTGVRGEEDAYFFLRAEWGTSSWRGTFVHRSAGAKST